MAPGGWSIDGNGNARLTGHLSFTFEDPLRSLPETARNLLVAAKEIVAEDGFEALTLKTVSERAGENKAMVSYYFDNKAGLIAAVLDSVIHDEYLDSLDRMKDVAPGERISRLVDEMQRMAAWAEDFQVFYELLPHVLRDEVLRRRMAMLYRWYWKMKLEWLGAQDGAAGLGRPRPPRPGPAAQRDHRRTRHPDGRRPRDGPRQSVPRPGEDARVARVGRERRGSAQAVGVELPPDHRVQVVRRLVPLEQLPDARGRRRRQVRRGLAPAGLERRAVHDAAGGPVARVPPACARGRVPCRPGLRPR